VLSDIEDRRSVEVERVRVTEKLRSLNETLKQRVLMIFEKPALFGTRGLGFRAPC
jgi:hypothetical protein